MVNLVFKHIKILHSINIFKPSNYFKINVIFFQKIHYYFNKLLNNIYFLVYFKNKLKNIQYSNFFFDINITKIFLINLFIINIFFLIEATL